MHIPDGYLSPSTCVALYAAAAPFWWTALQKVKKQLHTKFLPLLSLFAAFSFVIMMFNVPLPGGTSGHAVGVGIVSIVLGPWAAALAISIALLIQAVFFGDGGITALGANCFNMAIAGSFVAAGVYKLVAAGAPLEARRRIVAAALAGYCAINVSALLASIEFGFQPLLFRDSTGAPLYAPYPLNVAIPAMVIGHLTFAGLAELVVSGGVFAWLQRTSPSLLRRVGVTQTALPVEKRSLRPLYIGLALLMMLTPIGLLTVGTAWGEWTPADFKDAAKRREIAAASGNAAAPTQAPQGLLKLSSIWTAPVPSYAPPILRNPAFGYAMSAMLGIGCILLAGTLLTWFLRRA